jgi:hypothetical protein
MIQESLFLTDGNRSKHSVSPGSRFPINNADLKTILNVRGTKYRFNIFAVC